MPVPDRKSGIPAFYGPGQVIPVIEEPTFNIGRDNYRNIFYSLVGLKQSQKMKYAIKHADICIACDHNTGNSFDVDGFDDVTFISGFLEGDRLAERGNDG